MNKNLEARKPNIEGTLKEAVGYDPSVPKRREQREERGNNEVRAFDTDRYFATFERESKAQKNIRRDSLRAREDLNDFNVDSSL